MEGNLSHQESEPLPTDSSPIPENSIEIENKIENDMEAKTKCVKISTVVIKNIVRIVFLIILSAILFYYWIGPIIGDSGDAKKPIIYLYPEEKIEVKVFLEKPDKLTHTYPKYMDGWHVIASPNGDLVDQNTKRNLYALYWEGINSVDPNLTEGFVVSGQNTIEFLEQKLSLLGLNEREANEFIIYWLPELENNPYNFIRFQSLAEINQNMPMTITPTPDSIIRVMMEFKALDKPIIVKEQILQTPSRDGFTVVEWGGTQING